MMVEFPPRNRRKPFVLALAVGFVAIALNELCRTLTGQSLPIPRPVGIVLAIIIGIVLLNRLYSKEEDGTE